MAKCKYPNEVCANMTVLNGVAYCDSVPCSLKDELPKQTNADRIRSMTDEELAEFLYGTYHYEDDGEYLIKIGSVIIDDNKTDILEWLQEKAGD